MICGTLIRKKIWNGLAPSTIAASMVSSGMPRSAADRITMANPVWIQISTTIRKKLFQNGIVSQVCGWTSSASPRRNAASASQRGDSSDQADRCDLGAVDRPWRVS